MVTITVPDEPGETLEAIARQKNLSLVDVLADWAAREQFEPATEKSTNWNLIAGIGDENVTNMSTSVRETIRQYFKDKYGGTD